MTITISNILWDIPEENDEEFIDYSFLPDHVTIDTDKDEVDISELLFDEYGFNVNSFIVESRSL